MTLEYVIPGPPQPKERARRGAHGRWYTPERTRRYEAHARSCATVARMALGTPWPMDAWYRVELWVRFPDRRRRDVDNVAKAVLDSANGVLWDDDLQVSELVVRRSVDRERPRVEVVVEVVRSE